MPRTSPFDFYRRVQLARIYLDDGALRTAATRLRELAADIDKAADQKDADLQALVANHA